MRHSTLPIVVDQFEPDEEYLARKAQRNTNEASHTHAYGMGNWQRSRLTSRHEALTALSQLGTWMYAAQVGELIKIGITDQLQERMRHIRSNARARGLCGQVKLLAICAGDLDDERAVHERLAEHRASGREWYHSHAEVLQIVNEWREALGRQPVDGEDHQP